MRHVQFFERLALEDTLGQGLSIEVFVEVSVVDCELLDTFVQLHCFHQPFEVLSVVEGCFHKS